MRIRLSKTAVLSDDRESCADDGETLRKRHRALRKPFARTSHVLAESGDERSENHDTERAGMRADRVGNCRGSQRRREIEEPYCGK